MLAAFVLNGLSPYGLRILVGWGYGNEYVPVYLVYYYLGGVLFVGTWALLSRKRLTGSDIVMGVLMSLGSVGGQLSMGMALASGTPGNIVFPIAHSSAFIVCIGGVLIFKERMGRYGVAGIIIGLLAALLLGIVE
jgi:drug/metabolite transporter (DMT)-like permease